MPKIKITKNTQTRITDRLKILFGKSIIIGKIYDAVIVSNGLIADEPLKALYFENGTLLLSSKNQKYFVFLVGDMAAFRGRIYADSVLTSISFLLLLRTRYYPCNSGRSQGEPRILV